MYSYKLQKPAFVQEKSSFWFACSGGCRASDKEGRGHPDSKMGGGGQSQKNLTLTLTLKNKGVRGVPSPRSTTGLFSQDDWILVSVLLVVLSEMHKKNELDQYPANLNRSLINNIPLPKI